MSFSGIPDLPQPWDMVLSQISEAIKSKTTDWLGYKKVFPEEMGIFFDEGELTLENAKKVLTRDDFPKHLIPIREKLFEILA